MILNFRWSLGQITPFLGSKDFSALKLWANIKFFGKRKISELIDQRIELTEYVQNAVDQKEDLLRLNSTDINSVMIIFLPSKKNVHALTHRDMQKINDATKFIVESLTEDGEYFVHKFPLSNVASLVIPSNCATWVIRLMNGNPLTKRQDIDGLLAKTIQLGWDFMKMKGNSISAMPFY